MKPIEIRPNVNQQQHIRDVANALHQLNKQCKNDGLFDKLKELESYTPKSRKRRTKHDKAMVMRRKQEEQQIQYNRRAVLRTTRSL